MRHQGPGRNRSHPPSCRMSDQASFWSLSGGWFSRSEMKRRSHPIEQERDKGRHDSRCGETCAGRWSNLASRSAKSLRPRKSEGGSFSPRPPEQAQQSLPLSFDPRTVMYHESSWRKPCRNLVTHSITWSYISCWLQPSIHRVSQWFSLGCAVGKTSVSLC